MIYDPVERGRLALMTPEERAWALTFAGIKATRQALRDKRKQESTDKEGSKDDVAVQA